MSQLQLGRILAQKVCGPSKLGALELHTGLIGLSHGRNGPSHSVKFQSSTLQTTLASLEQAAQNQAV